MRVLGCLPWAAALDGEPAAQPEGGARLPPPAQASQGWSAVVGDDIDGSIRQQAGPIPGTSADLNYARLDQKRIISSAASVGMAHE